MKTTTMILICTTCLFAVTGCRSTITVDAGAVADDGPVRVGVFDSRGVALAYGRSSRSDCMMARVGDIRRAHEEAEQAGDTVRMAALEGEAQDIQAEIHRQVFSGAAIDDILVMIDADMPAIADAAGVDLIVDRILHRGPAVELVDVTHEMCAPFEPDEQTRVMITDIMTKPVVDESELRDH